MKALTVLFFAFVIPVSAHAAGKELEGIRAPANTTCPSPEESQKLMTVPDGYAVRCWAHEPMVMNPVAMTWDARGRLWVVEAYEYPEGTPLPVEQRPFGDEAKDDQYHPVPDLCLPTKNKEPGTKNLPRDRVIILEDTDNDGVADKRTVFVQGLNLASAIICGDDGIYVGQQPHLIHFKDSNHDDKPDEWRVVLTGFGREDTHELVNSFCWGPDGWLYMTHGVFTNSKVRRPGVPEKDGFKFDAGIGRCRPVTQTLLSAASGKEKQTGMSAPPWEFEVFADGTSNPWGTDYDARGNFFVSACVIDHFFHMAPGGIYVRQGGAPENPYAYEQLPSIVTHKHFRAAYAGVTIYQGGVYPQDTWGHAFIGNIHDNAIHEEVLTPVGSTFKCEPRRDFLRANNGWFRPVSTQTGPDGNLWVMDWCDKYPCYQNAKANPEGVDRERGRIWRIVAVPSSEVGAKSSKFGAKGSEGGAKSFDIAAKSSELGVRSSEVGVQSSGKGLLADHTRPDKDMDLAKLSTPELVKLLEHPNSWMRRKARRVLREKRDESAQKELEAILTSKPSMEVVWTLWAMRLLSDERILALEHSNDPALRAWAARLAIDKMMTKLASGCGSQFENQEERTAKAAMKALKPGPDGGYPISTTSPNAILSRLARDPDITVRLAVAIAERFCKTKSLTTDRLQYGGPPLGGCFPSGVLPGLLASSGMSHDQLLAFAIWQAAEPAIPNLVPELVEPFANLLVGSGNLGNLLTYKSMRRLCDTRKPENIDLALDFLTKIKAHDVLLAHALEGLEKGQEGGVIKPTKDFSALFAEFASSTNADVRKHAQNLATLWGDTSAIKRVAVELLDAKTPEAQRIAAVQTLRKVRNEAARAVYAQLIADTDWKAAPEAFAIEAMRAGADLGGDELVQAMGRTGILPVAGATGRMPVLLAALATLSTQPAWTHQMLDVLAAAKFSPGGFPVSLRRQLATSKDKSIRDHAFKVLGAWKESNDDVKALIATKKKACLEGEPDLAAGKLIFTATCMVCHTFYGGGQKVGPELIGSGRSNLDAILANVIDPNQIIGNGYENIIVTTKDNRTLMGRITEDTPSHVKLLAIGGAEQIIPRDQVAKLDNTHQSLMPMGFGGLPDDQFRNLIWYVLAPPDEGPLTPAKKKQLSTAIDTAPIKPKRASDWRSIDWESVSLWNPQWKVKAPEFEGTPTKRDEYHGRKNVLVMHPFEDKKTPASLERQWTVEASKHTLKFSVAADDRGDWELRVLVNDKVVKQQFIGHDEPRWKDLSFDLSEHIGKAITVRLEGHPTGWSWEFGYWHDLRLE